MQLPPHIAQALNQRLFNVHVNVFQLGPELKFPGLNLTANRLQRLADLLTFAVADQSNLRQHLGMRNRASDIVRIEPVIKADTLRKPLHTAIRATRKDATAGGTGHGKGSGSFRSWKYSSFFILCTEYLVLST
jgi:hypothetical protein